MTPTNEEPTATIIKSDTAGRPRYNRDYREKILEAYADSGMSGPAFAKHCGIKYPTFISWVAAKKRAEAAFSRDSGQKFLLAEVAPAVATASHSALHIALPGGASATIDDVTSLPLLAALIRELA